jgi:hypothetical protein
MDQPEELNQGEFAELERELRRALQRVDAPQGFAERTMARARGAGAPRGRLLVMPSRLRTWGSGAIAAVLVAGVFIGQQVHERRERERTEAAQEQFEAAMRITGETLDQTRLQLQEAGVGLEH